MSESEREDLQQMKVSLEKVLTLTNDQILDYGLKESNDDFNFLSNVNYGLMRLNSGTTMLGLRLCSAYDQRSNRH